MRKSSAATHGHPPFGRTRLFSVLSFSLALTACGDYYGPCGGPAPTNLKADVSQDQAIVTGISGVYPYRRVDQDTVAYIDDTTAVLPSELEFEISLQYEFLTQTTSHYRRSILDLLLPSAIACSPPYREPELVSTLSGANLTSLASMGNGLEAGQSLAPFFDIQAINFDRDATNGTQEQALVPLDTFGADEPVLARHWYRVSVRPGSASQLIPPSEELHRFTFSVTLNGNETYSADSRPVRVLVP